MTLVVSKRQRSVIVAAAVLLLLATTSSTTTTLLVGVNGEEDQQQTTTATTTSDTDSEYSFNNLKPCTLTSLQIANLNPDEDIEPCIIYDIVPSKRDSGSGNRSRTRRRQQENQTEAIINNDGGGSSNITTGSESNNNDAIDDSQNTTIFTISMVQVTPSSCNNHRDGAVTGVKALNSDNNHQGIAIGYQRGTEQGEEISPSDPSSSTADSEHSSSSSQFVQFRLVSVVAGNPSAMTEEEYELRHVQLLSSMLETLQAPYIVGSCTIASTIEKQPANKYKAILMAQVGPPGFYEDSIDNPYVFGFHIDSDTYPLPSVQSLALWAKEEHPGGPPNVPVRVIARTKSEFFASTCQSAISALQQQGFTDLEQYWMDHAADEDGDGMTNEFDEEYLINIADRTCPPDDHPTEHVHHEEYHPALFVCSQTEQDVLVRRWLDNGCRPVSLWVTASTWNWAADNPELVPYFQGGGQWHESFDYSDKFFTSGMALIEHNKKQFGYTGTYDQVVSYGMS
jgi:hypothetical protein